MLALLLGFLALNWQWVALSFAFATAETRPSLLSDAEWGKPESAGKFRDYFAPGTPESDLTKWLQTNRFNADLSAKRASRTIHGLPCNENILITWTTTKSGALQTLDAEVAEAGCL